MQLTQFTDYSLRTLIQLACCPGERLRIDDIQQAFGMSRAHLTKVIHRLGQLGYVRTTRGKNGGLELGRDPADINVGEVIRHIEPHFNLLECFDREHNTCPLTGPCLLKRALGRARDAFMAELDVLTLADISSNRVAILKTLEQQS